MIKLLPGLLTFFFLTTVIYAAASSIGFDKADYLIAPSQNQQIYAQLKDASGQVVKAESTTYVFIYPGSTSARVSSAISTPSFSATARLTIAKGTTQRSFLYQDSTIGTSSLTATGAGLLNGSLKITIGFPPPPPPPVVLPPTTLVFTPPLTPAPILASEPAVVKIEPVVEVPKIISTDQENQLKPVSPIITAPTPIASTVTPDHPQVLGQQSTLSPDLAFNFLDQIASWFMRLLSDNIGL